MKRAAKHRSRHRALTANGRTQCLLAPERLEEVLASVLYRRQERTERRREHIAESNKRAAEADLRLKRLHDAIETGIADLSDPGLKERIARSASWDRRAICSERSRPFRA